MKRYWVYMVCCRDRSFYVGITNDVDTRVAQHNFGADETAYTYTRRPVVLVFCSEFSDVWDAIRFEKQLKGWSRKKKLALIRGDWARIVAISRKIRGKKR